MRGSSENSRKPQTNFLESRNTKHFWRFLSYGTTAAEPLPMATRQVKQIMRHQLGKCADETRLLLKKSSLEKQRSSEGGNDSPLINWNHVRGRRPLVRRAETSPENKGGGARRRGGGVMSRWVKITWQARADHTQNSCQKSGEFCFC